MIEFLLSPWELPFMHRAFAVAGGAGLACGVVGVYVVLRGMAFIGDAVAHSAFPGVALAYALEGNLLLGGATPASPPDVLIAFVSQNRRLKEDTVIGVFFAFAFGLGIVLASTRDSWTTPVLLPLRPGPRRRPRGRVDGGGHRGRPRHGRAAPAQGTHRRDAGP
ncbi:metal ABC transporter permease [Streptomyces exfoliatus]|uniref:metal ABC transporter permease n=1 Tax=Streptomyces exfoliatus TaxID=1905 RepID=UPI00099CDF23|nr:metal ABC transporter permease [Streptomyces exfoliatus]